MQTNLNVPNSIAPIAAGRIVGTIRSPDDLPRKVVAGNPIDGPVWPTLEQARSAATQLSKGTQPAVLISNVGADYLLNRVEWIESGDGGDVRSAYFSKSDIARTHFSGRRPIEIIDA